MMVSRAVSADLDSQIRTINMVVEKEVTEEIWSDFANALQLELKEHSYSVNFITWDSDLSQKEVIYLVLDDGQQPLLVNPTPSRFERIATIVREGKNVFWISVQEDPLSTRNPEKGLVTGLARTAHAENDMLNLVTLDIQQASNGCHEELLRTVSRLLFRSFSTNSEPVSLREREYIYRDNHLLIPRVVPDTSLNNWISRATGKSKTGTEIFGQAHRPLKLILDWPGLDDHFVFGGDEMLQLPLKPSCIEIDVKACGVNQRDATIFSDKSKPLVMVGECAGMITAVGPGVTDFGIGDRVCAWGAAPYASRARIQSNNIYRLPDSMSFVTGASMPFAFMTAYHSLVRLAELQKGQTILILSAAGDIGQAALMIAQHVGAEILATVASNAQRKVLHEIFGLPWDQILFSDVSYFNSRVRIRTQGRGADVVLNCTTRNTPRQIWECLTSFGIFVQIGKRDVDQKGQVNTAVLDRNATWVSFDLMDLSHKYPHKTATLLSDVMSIFKRGDLIPKHSVTSMSIANVGDAFRKVLAKDQVGKLVLEVRGTPVVKTLGNDRPASRLDGNATYVLAGGLGDIGQRMCQLMVSRGARHIVVFSRRSLQPEKLQKTERALQSLAAGCKLYCKTCDISSESQVKEVASTFVAMGLPTVKGVVQAAMVLRVSSASLSIHVHSLTIVQDRTLLNMTLEDFQVPLQTKLYGTRHLSQAFQSSALDFFIVLSSAASIVGTSGQANYGAGNNFQDALANNTDSKIHYMSLNIGMVEGANVNNQMLERTLRRQGLIAIKPEELLAFLDYAMSSESSRDHCKQAIIGFDGQSLSQANIRNATSQTAMFSHIRRRPVEKKNGTMAGMPFREAIFGIKDLVEVREMMTSAIARKVSSLVASNQEEVDLNSSMAKLGLDSLMTLELRSWIAKEFEVIVQVSEILDQQSIVGLAAKVASSSKLVPDVLKINPEHTQSHEGDAPGPVTSVEVQASSPANMTLPRLPLPDLENTLQLYLKSRKHFLSSDEYGRMLKAIEEFLQEGGFGSKLQDRLLTLWKDPELEDWQSKIYADNIYLERRDPTHPFTTFCGAHLLTDVPHSQAERAAIISVAAFNFKQQIEAGTLEQDFMNEEPLDMSSLKWIFNAVREPCTGVDKMQKYPGNDYFVALRQGHVFKVLLKDGSEPASFLKLKATFDAILDSPEQDLLSVASLTAEERNAWAKVLRNNSHTDGARTSTYIS